jgi:hypothetical protein
MSKTITFNMATTEGSSETQGVVAVLRVDRKPHKFVLHNGTLTDYRTGRAWGSFVQRQALHYASDPYRKRLTDRDAAQSLISDTIMRHGAAKVRAQLDKYPTLNT